MDRKEFMETLKEKFNAWLVVTVQKNEDNFEVIDNYLIFTDDKVLHIGFHDGYQNKIHSHDILDDVKEETFLEYYYNDLLRISKQLDKEKTVRLLKIIEEIKPKYDKLTELLSNRI